MALNLDISTNQILGNRWLKGQFGIEKENIRVDKQGLIAMSPHPVTFGDKLSHPYITTDFSESQVEMITPPLPSIKEALGFLETIHDIVSLELNEEYLWPQSIPPVLPEESEIPIAHYSGKGKKEEEYRKNLSLKYGTKKQVVSGIHFNISLDEPLLHLLYREANQQLSFEEFCNEVYLKITRQLLKFRWLYILIFGSSPVVDPSYDLKCRDLPVYFDTTIRGLSLRNSCFGYGNNVALYPDYSSVPKYLDSIQKMVEDGSLSATKELYASVRPKFTGRDGQISYVEARFIDINPLAKTGLTEEMLHFVHALVIYGLVTEESDFTPSSQNIANINQNKVSLLGLYPEVPLLTENGNLTDAWKEAQRITEELQGLFKRLEINDEGYLESLQHIHQLTFSPKQRVVHKLLNDIDQKGFIPFHTEKAKIYLQQTRQNEYNFHGLEDMELSTQLVLRESVRRGIEFEILDRVENFIRLTKGNNVQYVCQATKTSLDNYASILAMENKVVTKLILEEHEIRVPNGIYYTQKEHAIADYKLFEGRGIVVKPKMTNFGLGITILKENTDFTIFERAVDIAFEQDSSILVEEFVPGKEFRFFVMDDEVVGILHRVPANVIGDGEHSIKALVVEKNKDPLRGKGYKTPLEQIQLGESEAMFLKTQKKSFDDIPFKDEIVYLRENSNISTGGDSIDFTDEIPESYKKIAVKATEALNVRITGLDMIISDYRQDATADNYAIIELNFNPAIHIHCHPYQGENRKLNGKLLDLLGFHISAESCANAVKKRTYLKFDCCELIKNCSMKRN